MRDGAFRTQVVSLLLSAVLVKKSGGSRRFVSFRFYSFLFFRFNFRFFSFFGKWKRCAAWVKWLCQRIGRCEI